MPTRDQPLLHLRLPCDSTAPARTRNALRGITEDAEIYDDLLLIASELVTNAVVHSGCSAPDVIVVGLARSDSAIRIWVDDPGHSDGVPTARPQGHPSNSSGLRVVSQIATRWGTHLSCGRRVWAELATGPRRARAVA